MGAGGRGNCIENIVATGNLQAHRYTLFRQMQDKARTTVDIELDIAGKYVGGLVFHATGQYASAGQDCPPLRRPGFVLIQYGSAVRAQTAVNLSFGPGNPLQGTEAFNMCRQNIGDQRHLRLGQMHEIIDFTGTAGAHFYDCKTMIGSQLQKSFGDADVVVQIALRGEHRPGGRENARHHLLDRGFTCAAGNRH